MAGDQWLIATGNIIIPYDVRMYISMSMSVYLKAASASVCLYSTIHIELLIFPNYPFILIATFPLKL